MKQNLQRGFTLIEIMVVVAIIGLLAAIAIPNLKRAIETARMQTCASNRKTIDGAKMQWALANKMPMTATPADSDIFGKDAFIEHKPDCPSGGVYSLNSVAGKCTCSVSQHGN